MKKEEDLTPGTSRFPRTRVLFVCVGNACRSPMAEAIAQRDAADVIEPSSAGLYPLGYIAEQTKQTLIKNGYSADRLTSDALTPEAIGGADLVINMTGRMLREAFRNHQKVENWWVEDPFDSDPETYQRAFEKIQGRVNQLAVWLREERRSSKTGR
ncbi:MAG TPA: low molecular weight phosphatase family protein [Candidatus Acidoferrum sp.]